MNSELAKKLLLVTMTWGEERASNELEELMSLATYKYDGYRNFEPGMRFFESLARWLSQFTVEEREAAFEWVKRRLLFVSEDEMLHLVSLAYPDHVFPLICRQAASTLRVPIHTASFITRSEVFKVLCRRSLFLGLSDGARMEAFRRLNPFLSNEQVYVSYEVSDTKLADLASELGKDIKKLGSDSRPTFQNLFLLDDFSGSGSSLLRYEDMKASYAGKLVKTVNHLLTSHADYFDHENLEIHILLYMATQQSLTYLTDLIPKFKASVDRLPSIDVLAVHVLPDSMKVDRMKDAAFDAVLQAHYDPRLEDTHTKKGGTNLVYGYAACGLPLVLGHNTPNNSVYLLWAETETCRPLFRRITRHKAE